MQCNELVMFVGLPRSGKSTMARKMGYPIVNPDSIRLSIHGQPFIYSAEPFVWACAKVMVRSLFLAGHDRVILDACNVSESRRQEWMSEEWDLMYVIMHTNVETCLSRCDAIQDENHREGLRAAIERMHREYESVTGMEFLESGENYTICKHRVESNEDCLR